MKVNEDRVEHVIDVAFIVLISVTIATPTLIGVGALIRFHGWAKVLAGLAVLGLLAWRVVQYVLETEESDPADGEPADGFETTSR